VAIGRLGGLPGPRHGPLARRFLSNSPSQVQVTTTWIARGIRTTRGPRPQSCRAGGSTFEPEIGCRADRQTVDLRNIRKDTVSNRSATKIDAVFMPGAGGSTVHDR